MLWEAVVCRIDDFVCNQVRRTRHGPKLVQDMIEGSPMLSHKALDVLKQKRSRHLGGQRGDDVLND
jgi:hypothetical protein